jgi:hypothetical protein
VRTMNWNEFVAALETAFARDGYAVQRLPGGEAAASLYIALGELSPNAQRFAKANGVQLMEPPALVQLLRDLKLPARA